MPEDQENDSGMADYEYYIYCQEQQLEEANKQLQIESKNNDYI